MSFFILLYLRVKKQLDNMKLLENKLAIIP